MNCALHLLRGARVLKVDCRLGVGRDYQLEALVQPPDATNDPSATEHSPGTRHGSAGEEVLSREDFLDKAFLEMGFLRWALGLRWAVS